MIKKMLLSAIAAMLVLGVPAAMAVECTGLISNTTVDDVFVPEGETCHLQNVDVQNGNVQAGKGSYLILEGVTVHNGNVQADQADTLLLLTVWVLNGDVQAVETTAVNIVGIYVPYGNIQISKGERGYIYGSYTDGDIQVSEFTWKATIDLNKTGKGNIQVTKNNLTYVTRNQAWLGDFQCFENNSLYQVNNSAGGVFECVD